MRMMQNRILRIALGLAVGALIAGGLIAGQILSDQNGHSLSVTARDFGGPFTLVNQDGETVTEADFEGKWRMLYFGFTFCPAICPTELQRIATTLEELGPLGEKITPIFISVDPERDTPEVMKQYVALFHPRMIGLTGSVEQIKTVKKSYKIYSARVQDETMSDYTVDHSSFIYLMSPDNDLVRIFRTEDPVEEIVTVSRQALKTLDTGYLKLQ